MSCYGLVLSVIDLCSLELTAMPGYLSQGRIDYTSLHDPDSVNSVCVCGGGGGDNLYGRYVKLLEHGHS